MDSKIEEEFLGDYKKFQDLFDEIVKDQFQGRYLEDLSLKFHQKYSEFIEQIPFTISTRYPTCSNYDTIQEDLSIIKSSESKPEVIASPIASILADIYRRLCQACYLRITYNKSRLKQEDNRLEAVKWARFALRYNPNDYLTAYWYMIALGWLLDATTKPTDRLLLSRVFRHSTLHCMRINPNDSLSHHLLGRYYYNIAGLNWLQRTTAKGYLGEKLEGTYEDCERELRQAHKSSDWLPTGLWMARCLLACQRPIEEIGHWINFGLNLEVKEPSTEMEREELLDLRSKLKLN